MDSLRYWVTEMHVDGFRFDLAATLARELHDVAKLVAASSTPSTRTPRSPTSSSSPNPGMWAKAAIRSATSPCSGPNGMAITAIPFAASGKATPASSPTSPTVSLAPPTSIELDGRKPYASINFVTAHDGFTLCDLVSYNQKHNEANGENNNDGNDNNDSWNMGAEGPTDDPAINEPARAPDAQLSRHADAFTGRSHDLRRRRDRTHPARQQQRLLPGQRDQLVQLEPRRSAQRAYSSSPANSSTFVSTIPTYTAASSSRTVSSAALWSKTSRGTTPTAMSYQTKRGAPAWNRVLAVMLNGKTLAITDEDGHPIYDDSFLIMVNAADEGVEFVLPIAPAGTAWIQVVDTENGKDPFVKVQPHEKVILGGRSLRIFREHPAQ